MEFPDGKLREDNTYEKKEMEDEDEDEKMEKFFAILRSYVEARNRRRKELEEEEKFKEEEVKRRRELELMEGKTLTKNCEKLHVSNDKATSWVPKFEWEDFNTDFAFKKTSSSSSLCSGEKRKSNEIEKDADRKLKLKLTL